RWSLVWVRLFEYDPPIHEKIGRREIRRKILVHYSLPLAFAEAIENEQRTLTPRVIESVFNFGRMTLPHSDDVPSSMGSAIQEPRAKRCVPAELSDVRQLTFDPGLPK